MSLTTHAAVIAQSCEPSGSYLLLYAPFIQSKG